MTGPGAAPRPRSPRAPAAAVLAGLLGALAAAVPAAAGPTSPPSRDVPAPLPGRPGDADTTTERDTLPEEGEEGAWNGPRARELVLSVAEARRRHPYGDTTLRAFRARAEGHTYFLFDPGPAASLLGAPAGPRLVRADQLALRIAWRAPGRWRQTVVGRRSERLLPTRIRYHDDHLQVLLEHFGGTISMGRGTELRDVPHPAAPGALSVYEYRLVDSLEVRLAGDRRRLFRLQVRPRDPDRPAVVGDLFVDGTRPAVARLSVTFTSAAYRDPQLEHISVDLESGLIGGRYWLPVRQSTEIHRQATWLDVPAGGTIRTRYRITDYRLNPEDPVRVGPGERLVSLPDSAMADFDGWRTGLMAGPTPGGADTLAADVDLEEVRARARRIVGGRTLSGIAPSRLYLPDASHALRVRRGEGVLAGAGVRHRAGGWEASAWAGYAFGAERPEARLAAGAAGRTGPALTACLDCLADVGPFAASSGLGASLSALLGGDDYRDPYVRTAVRGAWRFPVGGGGTLRVGAGWERHESAAPAPGPQSGPDARPVRPVNAGEAATLDVGLSAPLGRALGARWHLRGTAEAASGAIGDFGYSRALVRLRGRSPPPAGAPLSWRVRLAAAAAGGRLPAQRLPLLGGRGTVPGHAFRPWGGDRLLLGELSAAADVLDPWVRARARLSAGWTRVAGPGAAAAERLGVRATGGVRPSAGVGVGLLWDALRLHVDRGLRGGRWALNLSVDPEFWPIL